MKRPLHDRVFVRADKHKEKVTATGIIIPEAHSAGPVVDGEVVAIGPGYFKEGRFIETTVKAGQRVSYLKHAGQEIEVGGEKLLLLFETELVAVDDAP